MAIGTSFANNGDRRCEVATVFLIDDDADGSELLAQFLERSGHSVHQSSCARSALGVLPVVLPDVVVLDFHLPHMDGFTFLRKLRDDPVGATLPVVLLTGDSDPDLKWRGGELGVVKVFLKGDYDLADMLGCINSLSAAPEPATPPTLQHRLTADEPETPVAQSPA